MTAIDRTDQLAILLRDIIGPNARLSPIEGASGLADSAKTMLVQDGASTRILQISPVGHPDIVAAANRRARAFADSIGNTLAAAVVLPLFEGQVAGRCFAMLPFQAPFRSGRLSWWYQRHRITPFILDWLADIAALRRPFEGDGDMYRENLTALSLLPGIDGDIAAAATAALDRHAIACAHVPMHGDLWRGNILTAPEDSPLPFSVIDWRGSAVDGYPVFDLFRLAGSYRLSPRRLHAELSRHARAIGCPIDDMQAHLLAALGHVARNIGEMPLPAFHAMSRTCIDLHAQACAAG